MASREQQALSKLRAANLYAAQFAMAMGIPYGKNSVHYFADPVNGSDNNNGLTPETAKAGVEAAYALTVEGQHDTVFLIAGSSGVELAAAVTWAKDFTHLVGVSAPVRTANGANISQVSTLTGASPLFTISADGCIFKNFSISQAVDDATSLINTSVTGNYNHFDNVHFAGGGHATQAVNGGASLMINGGDDNLFSNCTIGVDTVAAATGMVGLLFDGAATRNRFEKCAIRLNAGNSGVAWVEVVDATGLAGDTVFDNCSFLNNSVTALASGFVFPTMASTINVLLKDCIALGSTTLDVADEDVLFGNMNAITGADLSGVAVELIT
ncbi:MAG: hypothetical protein JRE40_00075 [Deltaproteobacteria bacterium]|nr:hypothetical protein [Deltaproteobacteria bacterium]